MNFAARITVRQNTKTGRTVAGFASNLPRLSAEWRDIGSGGKWFASQMRYAPFRAAMNKAQNLAQYYSDLAAAK